MECYSNFDFTPIYNYYKASEDVRYIMKLDDYSKLPEVTEEEEDYLTNTYVSLIEQDSETNLTTPTFSLICSITRLQNKYHIIKGALNILRFKYYPKLSYDFNKYEDLLKKYGYDIKYKDQVSFYLEIDKCYKKLGGLVNQIKIKQDSLLKKQDTQNKKEIYDTIAQLNIVLGVNIDPYRDTMRMYKAYINEAKKMNNGSKHKR